MPKILMLLAGFLLQSAVKKLLLGAGLGLVSMAVIQAIFDQYMHYTFNSIYGAGGQSVAFSFIYMFGLDRAISIILGAVTARVVITSMQKHLA